MTGYATKFAGAELRRQHDRAMAVRQRLYDRPGARPGANLPRNGKTLYHAVERDAVDMEYAVQLVCEDRQLTRLQLFQSKYSAAVAARHMLWAVLCDGGHPVAHIARIFDVDHATVREGIAIFRDFQAGVV